MHIFVGKCSGNQLRRFSPCHSLKANGETRGCFPRRDYLTSWVVLFIATSQDRSDALQAGEPPQALIVVPVLASVQEVPGLKGTMETEPAEGTRSGAICYCGAESHWSLELSQSLSHAATPRPVIQQIAPCPTLLT